MAHRGAAADRRPGADGPRRRPGRGPRPGRPGGGARGLAGVGRAGQPRRLAHGHREAARHRPAPPPGPGRPQARGARPPAGGGAAGRRAGPRGRDGRPDRRRPPGPDLHHLPPGALHRRAGGAHAAAAGRAHDRGDRPGLPGAGADAGPAHRPGQAHPRRGARALRGAGRPRAEDTPGVRARGRVPDLQRGLLGDRRRRLGAAGAVRGRAPARAHPRRAGAATSPRCTGSSR